MTTQEYQTPKRRKWKLYKDKKFIAILLAGVTLATGGTTIYQRLKNKYVHEFANGVVGHFDIPLFTNNLTKKIQENDFTILNIGNHNKTATFLLKQKLEYCQKNSINIGLLVESNAKTLADIYYDLEYVMGIMEQYPITYPIYLNVDLFLDNEELTYDQAMNLIKTFLNKAEENRIFVGVYGKEENIKGKFNDYTNIITDKELNIKPSKWFNFDDYYISNDNLKETITNSYFNDSVYFKEDGYVLYDGTIDEDTFLKNIAYQSNLSVSDLKRYNGLDSILKKLKTGDILRIPSFLQEKDYHIDLEQPTGITQGIDVSRWQGEINWDQVDVDYAIIQIRDFKNESNDPQFENNVTGCTKNDIPMGFYIFSRATNTNEVKEEAKYTIEQLKGVNVTYPIYLDLETEYWSNLSIENNGFNQEVQKFIETWEYEIKKAGYLPGIYCNLSTYQAIQTATNNYLDNLQVWVAGGEYYEQTINLSNVSELPTIYGTEEIDMKQISQFGKIDGLSGNVDANYCYVDYENNGYNWERMKFPKYGEKIKIATPFLIGSGLMIALKSKKRKNKKRVRKHPNSKNI